MTHLAIGSQPCTCGARHHQTRLIAVTGGPGAGKTAVLEAALRTFCAHVGVLPEAAGVLFGGGFPRHDTEPGRRAAQRAIYHVQREAERLVVEEGEVAVGLCDRGTIDGVAYWAGPREAYWEEMGTTRESELARYRAVIHMRTPSAGAGYDHSNPLRVESSREAAELDSRILDAWAGHPNRLIVASAQEFIRKATDALHLIRSELPPCCHVHPIRGEPGK